MSNWLTDAIAKESAYDEGFEVGRQSVAEEIFEELEAAMQRSKTTHAGWEFFGMILEDYVEDMKKKYGVK